MNLTPLSPNQISDALNRSGFQCKPEDLATETREERILVYLPDNQIAWFALSSQGREMLAQERRVLQLLAQKCTFAAPRIVYVNDEETFEVRTKVPGAVDPWRFYALVKQDPVLAARMGTIIGHLLAEQHRNIQYSDVEGWLPTTVAWPMASDWIRSRVSQVIDDRELLNTIESTLESYEALSVQSHERALIHTDLGLHNLAIDASTYEICGIFDYAEAAWADCHHDFRYLMFDVDRPEMLSAALFVYEPAMGVQLSRQRIYLYNALCAISFLAYRLGTAPAENSCGRTLAQDVNWCRQAMARLQSC